MEIKDKMYRYPESRSPEIEALLQQLRTLMSNQPPASSLPEQVKLPGGMRFPMPQLGGSVPNMNPEPAASNSPLTQIEPRPARVPSPEEMMLRNYRSAVQSIKGMKPGDEGWRDTRNQVKTYGRELGKDFQKYLPKPAERANPIDQGEVLRYRQAVNRIGGLDQGSDKFEKNKGIIESVGKKYGYQYQNKIPKAATTK